MQWFNRPDIAPVTVASPRCGSLTWPTPLQLFDVSTVFVDNFVDKGILIPRNVHRQAWCTVNWLKIHNYYALKSNTYKMLPRREKITAVTSLLCISAVFRKIFLPKSSTFCARWGNTAQQHKAALPANSTHASTIRFVLSQLLQSHRITA